MGKTIKLIAFWVFLALGLSAVAAPVLAQGGGTTLYLPLISKGPPLPPPDEASARISLPAGFHIRIYAENLTGRPRFMAIGPDGHLYLSLMDAGQVVRLPDRNRDGLADGTEVIAGGLNLPHGLAFYNGYLYIAEGDRIKRLAGPQADGSFGAPQLVTDNIPGPLGHSSRTVIFGPDGKMYVSAGSKCNIPDDQCEEDDPRRAAVLRFNPDGSIPSDNPFASDPDERKRPLWAWGLRNSVGLIVAPGGGLWANHNGSDGLGDDLPPEEIVIEVQGNRHYGWPYCYTPGVGVIPPDTREVRDTRIALPSGFTCAQAVPALFTAPAHSAPLGMTLGKPGNFPSDYVDDLFVAYHGSWNTTAANIRDCKVERVLLENGKPVGSQTFATGWRAPGKPCGDSATWGRPADVIFNAYGEMFISDDKGNRVYRVIYAP